MTALLTIIFLSIGQVIVDPTNRGTTFELFPDGSRVKRLYWDDARLHKRSEERVDKENRQHGEAWTWFESGVLRSKTSYRHGAHLLHEEWFLNGEKRVQQTFVDGLPEGTWIWWDDAGNELIRSTFVKGDGTVYFFDDQFKLNKQYKVRGGEIVQDDK